MNNWIYLVSLLVFWVGLLKLVTNTNYWHKLIALNILQSGVLLFYLAIGKVQNPPIYHSHLKLETYTSPLPQVLMLTAIVVGFSTFAVGMALVRRIHQSFGTIDEQELASQLAKDRDLNED